MRFLFTSLWTPVTEFTPKFMAVRSEGKRSQSGSTASSRSESYSSRLAFSPAPWEGSAHKVQPPPALDLCRSAASSALRTSRAPARPTTHTSCAPRVQEATTGSSESPAQRRGQNSPARSDSPTELSQAPSVTELSQVPAGGDESQASPRTRVKGRAAHSPSTAQTPPQSRPAVQRPAAQPAAALDLAEETLLQELFGRS